MFWTNTSHEEKEGESMNKVNAIEVIWNDILVGRLALTKDRLCAFEYSNEFINNGISISPFELPLQKGVMIAKRNPFEGGFGVFDDCLPDGWGLLILNRYLQKKGIKIGTKCTYQQYHLYNINLFYIIFCEVILRKLFLLV